MSKISGISRVRQKCQNDPFLTPFLPLFTTFNAQGKSTFCQKMTPFFGKMVFLKKRVKIRDFGQIWKIGFAKVIFLDFLAGPKMRTKMVQNDDPHFWQKNRISVRYKKPMILPFLEDVIFDRFFPKTRSKNGSIFWTPKKCK